jgi:membrane protease YdiL (CAAX protease family)
MKKLMSETASEGEAPPPAAKGELRPGWREFFLDPLRRTNAEARAYLASEASRRPDTKLIVVLLTAALCFTAQRYVAMTDGVERLLPALRAARLDSLADRLTALLFEGEDAQARQLTWWVGVCLATNVVVPMLLIRWVFRERVRDYGVKLRGAFADYWVYVVMLAVAWPAIFLASAQSGFQETYPFYRLAPGAPLGLTFWRWEALYGLQFFGVEFMFRGFLLHGTRHRFGAYSIPVMMVPYCMLHFFKPLPETLAAIVGAFALGFMSLRTRSIWMGTAIHVTVAWSMDFASLWRQGLLF